MPASRSSAPRRIAGALLVLAALCRPQDAGAATASFDVKDQAVVQVIGRAASITIRTWNRNTVQVDWPDGEPFESVKSTQQARPSYLIPTVTVNEYRTPAGGPVVATLLPEDFPVPGLTPGMHDVVRISENRRAAPPRQARPAQLIVTIPASTGLINVRSGRGAISLTNYAGTTIAAIGHGRIVLRNVSGDAFVQLLSGHFYALDSSFDRLRIRSNQADEVFDACRVKQIEATTLTGDILFDNGVFTPGLARFESDRGSIAVGVNGGAQLGAHTRAGRVLTVLPMNTTPDPAFLPGGDSDSLQFVGTGGPLVNASTVRGNVLLYDGSLADRRPTTLAPDWHAMYELLVTARNAAGPAAGARPSQTSTLK